jgi:glutamate-1-semialdehyde aminotransferase
MHMLSKPTPNRSDIAATAKWMARARRVLAYGGFDGIVQRPLYYGDDEVFPQFAASAEGYELIDTTGQRFVDWVNGWGPVILGYRHPAVERAIAAQFTAGPTLSLMHPLEIEVAEMLQAMIPCAEMVAFAKNGSDSLTAAVRVARAVTGRRTILQYGMHGFHDWYICSWPQVRGIPDVLRPYIESFPYGDLAALRARFDAHPNDIAAVVMEPVREILPPPGYLEGVREITRQHGSLFIYDEVITALRLGRGGAQEAFGVVPDIACLGKSLGNGMPLSAVVGKREFMQHLPSVGFGMTFRGETLSLAAARAVLEFMKVHDVAGRLRETGEKLRSRFAAVAKAHKVGVKLAGPAARMTAVFDPVPALDPDAMRALFVQECLKRGVFTNGNMLPSFAHDDVAIERTIEGVDGAVAVLAEAIRRGAICDERPQGGAMFAPRAMAATGFVEGWRENRERIQLNGWILLPEAAPTAITVRTCGAEIHASEVPRPDLAGAFPTVRNAGRAGFVVELPRDLSPNAREDELTLCAWRGDQLAFRCKVVRSRTGSPDTPGPWSISDGVLYF